MLSMFFVLLGSAVCIVIDLKILKKSLQFRHIALYLVLWLLGITAALLAVNNIELPSPLYIIIWLYTPVNQLVAYMFGLM